MQHRLIKKILTLAVIFPGLVVSTVGSQSFLVAQPLLAQASEGQSCSTITLTSGTNTQTAGYTETNPTEANALLAGSYTPGSFSPASITQTVIPPWVDPATDSNFSTSSAVWISTHSTWPGGSENSEGSAGNDQWRLFRDSFVLPAGAVVSSANIVFSADNAANVYLNGNTTAVATTNGSSSEDVYGVSPVSNVQNFSQVFSASFSPVVGANTLDFVVRNWGGDYTSNPTGLLYKATVEYCVPIVTPPTNVTVSIAKYLDGTQATAESASSTSFPMHAIFPGGEGDYALSPVGFNNDTPYQATTALMPSGSDYSTYEITSNDSQFLPIGSACVIGKYVLDGYQTSPISFADAASSTIQTSTPSFTDLMSNQYVIVRDSKCTTNSTSTGGLDGEVIQNDGVLHVDSITVVKSTSTADGTFAGGWRYVFHITTPNTEPKLGMKFADWINGVNTSTIPVANNMRISSLQADNGGATVLLTAANTYSVPKLNMTSDLNPAVSGRQVDVTVEVSVPVGTPAASYSTSYGVQTTP